MIASIQDRTIALAGVLQAASLVDQIAQNGQCSGQAAQASLASIFQTDPKDTASTFGGLAGVRLGLRTLTELLGAGSPNANLATLQTAVSILKLGGKIKKDQTRLNGLSDAVELTRSAWDSSEEPLDPCVVAQLADAYQEHISTHRFRIKVQGNPNMLKNPQKVQLIRALLLAGIRSAILWQQLGGNQWRLMSQRKAMVQTAETLIGNLLACP